MSTTPDPWPSWAGQEEAEGEEGRQARQEERQEGRQKQEEGEFGEEEGTPSEGKGANGERRSTRESKSREGSLEQGQEGIAQIISQGIINVHSARLRSTHRSCNRTGYSCSL